MSFVDDVAAIGDLFAHYMEAWNSWYVEAAQEQNIS